MADSQTQADSEPMTVADARDALAEYATTHSGKGTDAIRTLLAAYTTAEADMAEARKLMEPFVKLQVSQLHGTPHVLIDGERRSMSLTMQEHLRALAAFYNKGEE